MKYGRDGSPAACAGLAPGCTSTGLSGVTSVVASVVGALTVAAALAVAPMLPVVAVLASSAASCARAVDTSSPVEIASTHNPTKRRRLILFSALYTMVPPSPPTH